MNVKIHPKYCELYENNLKKTYRLFALKWTAFCSNYYTNHECWLEISRWHNTRWHFSYDASQEHRLLLFKIKGCAFPVRIEVKEMTKLTNFQFKASESKSKIFIPDKWTQNNRVIYRIFRKFCEQITNVYMEDAEWCLPTQSYIPNTTRN